MPKDFSHLSQKWEAEIASLSSALASLGTFTTPFYPDAMVAYIQQLEQQLAAAQQAYGLLQTLQNLG